MVNKRLKTAFLIFCLMFSLNVLSVCANENVPNFKTKNYDEIYENLEEVDFDYIFGIDPHQADDYTKYMYSPYPLFRSGVNLVYKNKIIPPGYYLLTPREKNGKTYVLFKNNGKVLFVIPTYNVDIVPEMFYEEKFPRKKETFGEKMRNKTMNFIGEKWGEKNKRTPIPKAYIEFNDEGIFWDMILYYGDKKYYLLFKKD